LILTLNKLIEKYNMILKNWMMVYIHYLQVMGAAIKFV